MKRMLLAAAVAIVLAACSQQGRGGGEHSTAASAQLPSEEETRAYIGRSEEEWAALATRRDPSVLERILADDYAGVSDDGTVRNKAQEIAYWSALPLAASAEQPQINYRIFGNTALAQGEQTLTPEGGGAPVRILWTDVWLFRDGKWQVVASQNAVAPRE